VTRPGPVAALVSAALALATAVATAGPAGGASGPATDADLALVRSATARFQRVEPATAAGYARMPAGAPLHECIDMDVDLDDQDGAPAMGIHLVNGGLLDGRVDAQHPEALVYEPEANGRMRLVALEYVVFASDWAATGGTTPPSLFGRQFSYTGSPNRYDIPAFYALHAWVWQHNPDGMFAPMNPTVTCAHAAAAG
jgi:hypothetical protein